MPRPPPKKEFKRCRHCQIRFSNYIRPRETGSGYTYVDKKLWKTRIYCTKECYMQVYSISKKQKLCIRCGKAFNNIMSTGIFYKRGPWEKRKYCSLQCANVSTGPKMQAANYFATKVSKKRKDGCVYWQGSKIGGGYGIISFRVNGVKRTVLAHRLSYALRFGVTPKTRVVCHTCDVKRCVNPDHLYLGDYATNAADRLKVPRPVAKDVAEDRQFYTLTIDASGHVEWS